MQRVQMTTTLIVIELLAIMTWGAALSALGATPGVTVQEFTVPRGYQLPANVSLGLYRHIIDMICC